MQPTHASGHHDINRKCPLQILIFHLNTTCGPSNITFNHGVRQKSNKTFCLCQLEKQKNEINNTFISTINKKIKLK
jgi:hypothetical protein